MLIPTLMVIICLTLKMRFPSGVTDASFLPPVLSICVKVWNGASPGQLQVPASGPVYTSHRSLLSAEQKTSVILLGVSKKRPAQNSPLQQGFLAPDHTDHSVELW